MWFTIAACSESSSWLCFFFSSKVSQEITTSFCECLCEGVNWDGGESEPSLSFVLMLCSLRALRFQFLHVSYRLFLLYCTEHNGGWQQRCRWDRVTCGWIRVKLTTYPGMNLSHLIYSAPYSPAQTLYISFDLLTLIMVSLKISSSISSAILKPLILPERERERGRGWKLIPSVMFIWHFPLARDSVGCDC